MKRANMFFNFIILFFILSSFVYGIYVIAKKTNQPALTMGDHALLVIDLAHKSDKLNFFLEQSGKYAADEALYKYAKGDFMGNPCGTYQGLPLWNKGTKECYPLATHSFFSSYLSVFEEAFARFRESHPLFISREYTFMLDDAGGTLGVIGSSLEEQRFSLTRESIMHLGSASPDTASDDLRYLMLGESVTLTTKERTETMVYLGIHKVLDDQETAVFIAKDRLPEFRSKAADLIPHLMIPPIPKIDPLEPPKPPAAKPAALADLTYLLPESWASLFADLGDALKTGPDLKAEFIIPDYHAEPTEVPQFIDDVKLSDKQREHAAVVMDAARTAGIPVNFALALAYTESSLRHEGVVSGSHAYGIMQVTPLTACESFKATPTAPCPPGPGVPCPGIVLSTASVEENAACGMNILNLKLRREARETTYINGVNKFCSSSKNPEYNERYLSYIGDQWKMVARTYNGFGCSVGSDPDYVEKIMKRMVAIR